MEGNLPGQYEIYWPPVFPDIWIPECEVLQVDISIRDWVFKRLDEICV